MSSIQDTVAVHLGPASNPRPMSQERRDHQRDVDALSRMAAPEVDSRSVSAEDLQAAAAQLKQVVEASSGNRLNFDIFEETQQLYVKVRDVGSGEVIKTIPAEELLHLRKRIGDIVGLVLDEQA